MYGISERIIEKIVLEYVNSQKLFLKIEDQINELISKAEKEVINRILDNAPETYDTLKEISDWIKEHQDEYNALLLLASTNKTNFDKLKNEVDEFEKNTDKRVQSVETNVSEFTENVNNSISNIEKNMSEFENSIDSRIKNLESKIDDLSDKINKIIQVITP